MKLIKIYDKECPACIAMTCGKTIASKENWDYEERTVEEIKSEGLKGYITYYHFDEEDCIPLPLFILTTDLGELCGSGVFVKEEDLENFALSWNVWYDAQIGKTVS